MRRLSLWMLTVTAAVLLSGCRIGVSVFEGGDVVSASTQRNCFEGNNCEFAVDSPLFAETFTAQPRHGFVFTKWRGGEGFLCGNSTNPHCTVSLVGKPNAGLIVSSDEIGYLVPEFTCVGICPDYIDGNVRGFDEALAAMEEAKDAVAAYVAANGGGAPDPQLYGVNLGTRSSAMLRDIDIVPSNATGLDLDFYIVANVFRRVWGDTENPWQVSSFALSGETNNDGSMTWRCIPAAPGPNSAHRIPTPWLPAYCRG